MRNGSLVYRSIAIGSRSVTEIIIIFFLLVLNAFFAMSELAIVSASRPLLRQLAKQGNARAATALGLAEDSGNFLSTVQVGITLVAFWPALTWASITKSLGGAQCL